MKKHIVALRIAGAVLSIIVAIWAMRTDHVLIGVISLTCFVLSIYVPFTQMDLTKGEEEVQVEYYIQPQDEI